MKVLCIDNEPHERKKVETGVAELDHQAVGCNGAKAMAITNEEALSFDAAVVDQNLENDITGEEVGVLLRSMNPNIFLIMLTAYSKLERAVEAMKGGKFDDYIAKGTSKTPELLRKALANANTHAQLYATQEVAHGSSPLFEHVRHLVGIDKKLCEISNKLEALFMWQANEWDSIDEIDRPDFVSSLLLRGEPGCGKSDIAQAIVAAFNNDPHDSFLPKDLGPTDRKGAWKRQLEDYVWPLFNKALTTRQVVVIVADDLAWQSPGTMLAGEWKSEFQNYMQAVRDCIMDAHLINTGKPPSHFWKDVHNSPQGKILWVFAKNLAEDVGGSYAALETFMPSFDLKFPCDDPSRRQALSAYASRRSMKFDSDALNLAVKQLLPPAYRGRELLAEERSGQGFAFWCVDRVKKLRIHASKSGLTVPRIITPAIVQDWLNSEQHKAILGSQSSTGLPPSQSNSQPSHAEAGVYTNSTAPDHLNPTNAARDARANVRLIDWNLKVGEIWAEKTRDMVSNEEKQRTTVTTEELGRKLEKPCTGANLRAIFARHSREMRELVSKEPGNFANLCRLDCYKKWFGEWLEFMRANGSKS